MAASKNGEFTLQPVAVISVQGTHRRVVGLSGRRVLSQLGPLCGLEQSLIRNSLRTSRTSAFQYGERVLSTLNGRSEMEPRTAVVRPKPPVVSAQLNDRCRAACCRWNMEQYTALMAAFISDERQHPTPMHSLKLCTGIELFAAMAVSPDGSAAHIF